MTDKIHGFAHTPGQALSGGLPMFTATVTGANLTTMTTTPASGHSLPDVATESHAPDLDALIQIISIRAQPVIMGTVGATTLNFAVEHNDIFGDLTAFNAEATAAFSAYKAGATVTITPFVF